MIADRLGFALRADFLADVLGFRPVAIDGSAKLYNESDWSAICARLSEHVQRCAEHDRKAK